MILIAGVILSLFLSILLISKKNKTFADKILATWLISIALYLFIYHVDKSIPQLIGVAAPIPLLQGPFLYLYTAGLTGKLNKKISIFYHFIIPLLFLIITMPFYSLSNEEKVLFMTNGGKGWELEYAIGTWSIYISGIVYVIWTLSLLTYHQKNILNQFSDIEKINLKWLKYLIYSIAIIWGFVFYGNDDLVALSAVLFVYFIGYYGIKQVGIFTTSTTVNSNIHYDPSLNYTNGIINEQEFEEEISSNRTEEKVHVKYKKSNLSDEKAQNIHKQLILIVTEEKIFKNPEISLVLLSKKLNVHPNALSQVINSIEKKNFYDFINELRIREFKRIVSIPSNKKYTLLSLAFECGFNSKTSFNRNFKKVTNLSPTEYCKTFNFEIID